MKFPEPNQFSLSLLANKLSRVGNTVDRRVYGSCKDCINKEYFGGAWKTHNMVLNGRVHADCFGDLPSEVDKTNLINYFIFWKNGKEHP